MEKGHKLQSTGNNWLFNIMNNTAELGGQKALAINKAVQESVGVGSERFKATDRRSQELDRMQSQMNPLTGEGLFGGKSPDVYWEDMAGQIAEAAKKKDVGQIIKLATGIERSGLGPVATGAGGRELEQPRGPGLEALEAAPTPGQRAERTLNRAAEVAAQGAPVGGRAKEVVPKVDVAVSTVCTECHRKISAEEAKKAIAHHHDKQVKQNFVET